jgi:hypothetical protein
MQYSSRFVLNEGWLSRMAVCGFTWVKAVGIFEYCSNEGVVSNFELSCSTWDAAGKDGGGSSSMNWYRSR